MFFAVLRIVSACSLLSARSLSGHFGLASLGTSLYLHAAISEWCAVSTVGRGGAALFECGRVVLLALEPSGDEGGSGSETVLELEYHGPETEEDGMPSAVVHGVEQVWCMPALGSEDGDGK
jgi:hypothetical protein